MARRTGRAFAARDLHPAARMRAHHLMIPLALVALSACEGATDDPSPTVDDRDDVFGTDGKADGLAEDACLTANVLRRVNAPDLSAEGLKADGVHAQAARELAALRAGEDGVMGTGDDRRVRTLAMLDAVPYVGPAALNQLAKVAGKACAGAERYRVLFNQPFCDTCDATDKAAMQARSPMVPEIVALLDAARETIDVAQFTFSVKALDEALLRAHARGVKVRLAIDKGQDQPGTAARRLADGGVTVRFVGGVPGTSGRPDGLQHAKFALIDDDVMLTGSNNWSSTGTSINEESTIVVRAAAEDPLRRGFACHFEVMWRGDLEHTRDCGVPGLVGFTPGTAAISIVEDALREATTSVDVLMHHLVFDTLLKRLAQAAERGVRVRVVVNAADRDETKGNLWDRLRAAGGEVRYKRTEASTYQLMHHKLAIVDGRVLVNGSGNWSGSAFFNNYENYVRYEDPVVVAPYAAQYARLWTWALSADSLDAGVSAAHQDAAARTLYFGNLHAHFPAGGGKLDDGSDAIQDEAGQVEHVDLGDSIPKVARFAFQSAWDAGLDFMALSPHVTGDTGETVSNMTNEGFAELVGAAEGTTLAANGAFLALPAMEWSTNSAGNHVNVFGTRTLAKAPTGQFDRLYDDYLVDRAAAGETPVVMFNHPRTFATAEDVTNGNWDQIFDIRLTDIVNNSERKKKFNDFGIDDYPPLRDVLGGWIAGEAMPDPAVVSATLRTVAKATAPFARLMEVTVSRGTELGGLTPINPSITVLEDGTTERYTKVHRDFDYFLLHGFRLSPAANHDNHKANWGRGATTRTAVRATALTEEALMAALLEGRAYATEAPALHLDFYAGGRVPMGGAMAVRGARAEAELRLADADYAGPWTVTVWRGQVGGKAVEPAQRIESIAPDAWQQIALDAPSPGTWFFYVEAHQTEVDRMAWSAPIWIERID